MSKTKEISRRIKSISNTKKITKAMEMVAAAKMRRAIEAVLKTRTYAELGWNTVVHLSEIIANQGNAPLHPLLSQRQEVKKVAIILITSNRGMCGNYNSAIINKVKDSIKKHSSVQVDFILVGEKGSSLYQQGYNVAATFPKSDLIESTKEVASISKLVIDDFLDHKYDKILLAYTDYVNAVKQIPRIKQMLPVNLDLELEELEKQRLEDLDLRRDKLPETNQNVVNNKQYIFEPSPEEALNTMIPRLLEVQIYQAMLEANASEHSARMSAMRQATEAADDMVKELQLFYNKARQASITAEIAEISAGANAIQA